MKKIKCKVLKEWQYYHLLQAHHYETMIETFNLHLKRLTTSTSYLKQINKYLIVMVNIFFK